MGTAVYWILGALAIAGLLLFRTAIRTFWQFRGARIVTCPDNHATVAVEVDAAHAALSQEGGHPHLRLKNCTRWPEKQDCGQDCLSQIAGRPMDCLVKNIVASWYAGKNCAYCGKAFGEINWHDHRPALSDKKGLTVQWTELRPEEVPHALATHLPVCWDCHIAEKFRRDHPDLVTDRDFKR